MARAVGSSRRPGRTALLLAAAAAATSALAGTASAVEYRYNVNTTPGNWNDGARWATQPTDDANFPNAAGDFANLSTLDISGGRTVNVNVNVLLGQLQVGDTNNNNNYNIAPGTAGVLTFNNGGSTATIVQTGQSTGDTISAPIVLIDDLSVTNNDSSTLTVSGTVTAGVDNATRTLSVLGNNGVTFGGVLRDGPSPAVGAVLSLNKPSGTGTTILNGANTYTGGTTVTTGTLRAGSSTAVSGGAITAGPVGTGLLTLAGGGFQDNNTAITIANSLSVTANSTFSSSGTAGSLTFDGTTLGTPATITLAGTPTLTVTNTTTFRNPVGGTTFTKAGAGTLVLDADNTASLTGVTATGGVLRFDRATAIPGAAPARTITAAAGGAVSAGGALTFNQAFVDRVATASAGSIAMSANSAENIDLSAFAAARLGASANATYSGTLTLNGTTYRLGGGGATLTVSSVLGGAANTLNVSNNGSTTGAVVLSNANNAFTGVTVDAGVLQLSADGAAGSATSTLGAVPATPTNNITLQNGGLLRFAAASTLTPTRSIVLGAGGGGIDTNGNAVNLANALSGNTGFTKIGSGVLTVTAGLPTGNNITVTGGTLDLNDTSLTTGTGGVTLGGVAGQAPTLDVGTGVVTLAGNVTYNATNNPQGAVITGAAPGALSLGGTTRTFTVGDSTNAGNDLTIAVPITGTASAGITKSAVNSVLVLSASNTYPGTTLVNGGTLTLSAPGGNSVPGNLTTTPGVTSSQTFLTWAASDQVADSATVTLGGVSGNGGTIATLAGFSDTIGALTFANNQGSGGASIGTTGAGTLTVVGTLTFGGSSSTSSAPNTITGNLDLGGAVRTATTTTSSAAARNFIEANVANGGIDKTGAGALTVSGAGNTYAGGTTVTAGTLRTGVTTAGNVAPTVNTGTGVLGTGNVTVASAASGAAPTLELDNIGSINDAATLAILSGTVNGQLFINFTGTEVVGGLIVGNTALADGLYNVGSPQVSGFFAPASNPAGFIQVATVPEPAAGLVLAAGALATLRRRRRRHDRAFL